MPMCCDTLLACDVAAFTFLEEDLLWNPGANQRRETVFIIRKIVGRFSLFVAVFVFLAFPHGRILSRESLSIVEVEGRGGGKRKIENAVGREEKGSPARPTRKSCSKYGVGTAKSTDAIGYCILGYAD